MYLVLQHNTGAPLVCRSTQFIIVYFEYYMLAQQKQLCTSILIFYIAIIISRYLTNTYHLNIYYLSMELYLSKIQHSDYYYIFHK